MVNKQRLDEALAAYTGQPDSLNNFATVAEQELGEDWTNTIYDIMTDLDAPLKEKLDHVYFYYGATLAWGEIQGYLTQSEPLDVDDLNERIPTLEYWLTFFGDAGKKLVDELKQALQNQIASSAQTTPQNSVATVQNNPEETFTPTEPSKGINASDETAILETTTDENEIPETPIEEDDILEGTVNEEDIFEQPVDESEILEDTTNEDNIFEPPFDEDEILETSSDEDMTSASSTDTEIDIPQIEEDDIFEQPFDEETFDIPEIPQSEQPLDLPQIPQMEDEARQPEINEADNLNEAELNILEIPQPQQEEASQPYQSTEEEPITVFPQIPETNDLQQPEYQQPQHDENGYPIDNQQYDENGYPIDNQQYDENGYPIDNQQYDENGYPIDNQQYDENGYPIDNQQYDENGYPIDSQQYDENGYPIENQQYDENGYPIDNQQYDENGYPINNQQYDENGYLINNQQYDENGYPIDNQQYDGNSYPINNQQYNGYNESLSSPETINMALPNSERIKPAEKYQPEQPETNEQFLAHKAFRQLDFVNTVHSWIDARCIGLGNIEIYNYKHYGFLIDAMEQAKKDIQEVLSSPAYYPAIETARPNGLQTLQNSLVALEKDLEVAYDNASSETTALIRDEIDTAEARRMLGMVDTTNRKEYLGPAPDGFEMIDDPFNDSNKV